MPDGNIASVAREQRAYSTLVIKAINEETRTITGVASTVSADRMGDIVEPKGARFSLPMPLLWQHGKDDQVGQVLAADVGDDQIQITARFFQPTTESADWNAELTKAWAKVKNGAVRGLSIGFKPVEYSFIKETGGVHYKSWDWYELSAVTIPANAEASIQTIKSIDQAARAASGATARQVVHLSSDPGVSGKPNQRKGNVMKTPIAEQISALEAKRAATTAQRNTVQQKAMDDGRTKTVAEKEEFDTLTAEVDAIDMELRDLKVMEKQNIAQLTPVGEQRAAQADPVAVPRSPAPVITGVTSRLEPGQKMARWAMAQYRAKENRQDIATIIQANKEWMSSSPELLMVAKAAVAAGDTTTSGWASELVYNQNLANEFINYLRPKTIIGRVNGWRLAPFNIRVGSATAGTSGYWVGQGAAAPVSKMTTSSVTMGITKAVGLAAVDKELLMSSSPSAEILIRNDLAKAVQFLLDVSLIDPNQGGVANTQPAALTYGATTTQASGTAYSNLKTDVQASFAPFISANMDTMGGVWIMSPTTALALSMMVTSLGVPQFPEMSINGGTFFGLPVVVSQSAFISGSPDYGNMMVLLFPDEVFLADDGQVTIEMSDQTAIQLLDNPTNASTGGTTATTLVSMFQTNSVAIKATRFINWKAARTNVAAVIRTAAYS